jgi:hypothetical protein
MSRTKPIQVVLMTKCGRRPHDEKNGLCCFDCFFGCQRAHQNDHPSQLASHRPFGRPSKTGAVWRSGNCNKRGDHRSLLIDPVATVTANDCKSAVIQNPVVSPTLLDGLYPHATGAMGHVYTQTITVPSTPCNNCTLQLLQFMSSHPPDCFYHQCANLKIVARDAGVGVPDAGAKDSGVADAGPRDSGVVGTQDSGVLFDAGSSYDAGTGVDDAGATLDSGTEAQDAGMNADSGTAPIDNNPFVDPFRRDAGTGTNNPGGQGCSCNSSFDFAVLGLVAAFVVLRRKSV